MSNFKTPFSKRRTLPDFIIIGSAKCGTTSLHRYLSNHPEIFMSRVKEPNFFADIFTNSNNWHLGIDQYASQFNEAGGCLKGEASTTYTDEKNSRLASMRIKSVSPKMKLVYIMRHPLKRIQRYYLHFVYRKGISAKLSLDKILSDGPGRHAIAPTGRDFYERCVLSSLYFRQLSCYLEHFPAHQIHLMTLESLERSPEKTIGNLLSFLGIKQSLSPSVLGVKYNMTDAKRRTFVDPMAWVRQLPGYRSVSEKCPENIKAIYRKISHQKLNNKKLSFISRESKTRLLDMIIPDLENLKSIGGDHIVQDWDLDIAKKLC